MAYLKREILRRVFTQSIGAGLSEVITLSVTSGEGWKVKSISESQGPNTVIDKISIDGIDTGLTGTDNDIEAEFGQMPIAQENIKVEVTNNGGSSEDTTVTVKGIMLE